MRPVLVTGGAGFIGCNLSDRLATDGHDVLVFDSLARPGVAANLDWLRRRHPRRVSASIADIRDVDAVGMAAREAGAVFHLAGQTAVTTSLVEPVEDFETNLRGTLNVLEALRRRASPAPLIFASTNKVYGDLADVALELRDDEWGPADGTLRAVGVDETRPVSFHTPYGCSKGAADQYVLDWSRSYGVPTAVLRMSCVYGPHQRGTEDQGWVAHFLLRAMAGEPITVFGDGRQVRDVLYVDDAVAVYLAAWRRIGAVSGRAFNLGGGPANAVSLRRLLHHLGTLLRREVDLRFEASRPGDQRWFVADMSAARAALDLATPTGWQAGLARLHKWARGERGEAMAERAA